MILAFLSCSVSSEAADQRPNEAFFGTRAPAATMMRATPGAFAQPLDDSSQLATAVLQLTQTMTTLVNTLTGALQNVQFSSINTPETTGAAKSGAITDWHAKPIMPFELANWNTDIPHAIALSPDKQLVAFWDRSGKWYTKPYNMMTRYDAEELARIHAAGL